MKGNSALCKFMEIEDNKICFDCGGKPANWASINNGIFLCLTCSGNHRSLGVNISYIKSVVLDKWNDNQVSLMLNGGNTKLADLLEKYEIGADTNYKTLYLSKLMEYYRKTVRYIYICIQLKNAILKDNEILLPPSKEEALLPFDIENNYMIDQENSFKSNSNNNSTPQSLNEAFMQNTQKINNNFDINKNKSSFEETKKNQYEDHYYSWKRKYEQGKVDFSAGNSLEKIDTRGVPNNLFELKHKNINEQYSKNDYNNENNRFTSISSDPNYKETMNYNGEDPGIMGTFGGLVGDAFSRTKDIISNVKDKYYEYEVGDKLKTTGTATLGIIKYTGSTIHNIATSDTTKTIIGKTSENIGYLFNRIFYGASTSSNNNGNKENEIDKLDDNSNTFINNENDNYNKEKKNNYNRYSPPKNNNYGGDDELSGNILFKKDSVKYSSKSYMS